MAGKRIAIFITLTFVLGWAYEFLVVWPVMNGSLGPLSPAMVQLIIAAVMFVPALSVVCTRLITKEGFSHSFIAPVQFKKTWKYWIVGWFGPAALIAIGTVFYFIVRPDDFDSSLSVMTSLLAQDATDASALTQSSVFTLIMIQIISGIILAPALNFFVCFGEEWGWRGYLLPTMLKEHSVVTTLVVTGCVWGLWHAPLIMMGHNYGFGYWGYPYTGILMMCFMSVCLGVFNSYLTIKSGSCLPAVFAHGSINGLAQAGMLFSLTGGNPFMGPSPMGLAGGIGFIICAFVMAYMLLSAERKGENILTDK